MGWFLSILTFLVLACQNETSFESAQTYKDVPPPEAEAVPEPVKELTSSLNVYFPCDAEPFEAPLEATSEPVVLGAGTTDFPYENFSETIQLGLGGRFCTPSNRERDIVFIVDVSGSMIDNDPVLNGQCGRERAVLRMLSESGAKSRFALVTFSEGVIFSSSSFFSSGEELFADIEVQDTVQNVICGALESTFYDRSLEAAESLFALSGPDTSKEIFFLSDGAPTFEHEGIGEAQNLKLDGVTIAAVMLRGADLILKDYIASVDGSGDPLFAQVSNANDLEEMFAKLEERSQIPLIFSEIGFRPLGLEVPFSKIETLAHVTQEGYFFVPELAIDRSQFEPGIEVYYKYETKDGKKETLWQRIEFSR